MLVSGAPTQVEIPWSDAHVLLNRLSWRQLKEARQIQDAEARGIAKDWGPEILSILGKDADPISDETPEQTVAREEHVRERAQRLIEEQRYRAASYDTEYLLKYGLAEWSLSDACDDANKGKLGEREAMFIAQQIIDLTMPPSEIQEGEA